MRASANQPDRIKELLKQAIDHHKGLSKLLTSLADSPSASKVY
jgi:hypothetical protein